MTGLAFLGVDGDHGDGFSHDNDPLPIVSEGLTGISAVMNQQVATIDVDRWGHTDVHDVESTTGIALNVATTSVGQVIVRESGGSSRVYEQGQTTDTYTISLVSTPIAPVYVNISAAASPSEAAAAGARTVLVSIDGGATWQFAAVLTFAAGDSSAKTVLVRAIDDPAAEYTLDATLSMSSQSADPTYNHAEIRNVLAEVIDNDTAGIVITESDGSTTVLEGAPPYGIVDTYTVAPTMQPALFTNVKVTLFYSRDDLIVTSTDPRFDPVTRTFTFDWTNWTTPAVVQVSAAPEDSHWGENWDDPKDNGSIWHVVTSLDPAYVAEFGEGIPFLNPCCGGDQGHVEWSDGHGWLDGHGWHDQGWDEQHGWQNWYGFWDGHHGWHPFPHPVPRVDVNILRPDEDVVYVVESDGSTLVATGDPNGDTYTMRLTAAPGSDQTIRIKFQSDGQTLASDACGCDSRYDAANGTVTFDSTNWYLPFTVRLTSNPTAPATDPFQPLETFPNPSADRVFETSSDPHDFNLVGGIRFGNGWFDGRGWRGGPVWVDGHGWYDGDGNWFDGHGWFNGHDGWWFDGDDWFDGHSWFGDSHFVGPSLHSLLCNDGTPDHWHHGDWDGWHGGWNSGFGCEDLPARQPIILPNEQGAGPPPEFRSVSCDLVVEATSAAGALVNYDPAKAHGEVGPATIGYSQSSGTIFPIGTTTVIVTAIDEGGNYEHAAFRVTVRDTTAPVITTIYSNLPPVEATSAAGAPVTYAPAAATDAVGPVTFTYSKASGATFALGTTTVTVTATDFYGNHSSKSFTVTVRDTTAPVITAPGITVEATQSTGYKVGTAFPGISATDAVTSSPTLTFSKSAGAILPFGVSSVTVTAKDGAGNTSSATFTVTVQDLTAPVITAPDLVVEATGPSGAKVSYAPSATDAVGPVTITLSLASNTMFAIGSTPVTVTATDGHGNVATKTFTVKVQDTTAPVITPSYSNLPPVEAASAAGATVTYATAAATDAVGPVTIGYSQASGTVFVLGVTTVTVTATDGAGNASTKSFTVTVRDTTAPVITTIYSNLPPVEATSAAGAPVTYAPAAATDAVGPVTFTYSKVSGATFALGTTTVTVTATDFYGNHSSKSFTVTVRDTTAPVITAPGITVEATQSSGYKVGTAFPGISATDVVTSSPTLTFSKSAGAILPFGVSSVTVTAKDGAGNTSSATFTVTVQDLTAPVIMAPDLVVEATGPSGAKVSYAPSATDAVGPVTITLSLASNTMFAIGSTPVTVTATDGHGNVATKTFTVKVQDTTAPVITPSYSNLPPVEAASAAGATVTYATAAATDAVGPVTIGYSQASGTVFVLGVTTVTVTATDGAGNASTKSFTVTVRDTTAPVITTIYSNLPPVEATGAAGAPVTYAPAAATDAVGPVTFTYSKVSGATFALGTTTVTVTATDFYGNHSSKSFTVTVRDTTAPVITAPGITVEATQSSGYKVGTAFPGISATDVVTSSPTLTFSKSAGAILPFGVSSVTVTAKDGAGNTSSATFTVTVQDLTAPVITAPDLVVEATGPSGAKVSYAPSATDAVGPVTITLSLASNTMFAIGSTPVTVTATDGHGNVATKTFTVKVQDTTAPVIHVPLYQVVEAASLAGAVVNYVATATDVVGPVTISYSIANASLFALSFTGPVTVTATDFYGNTSTATFTVFVHDSTAPALTTSSNLVIEATGPSGSVVNYAAATATDALGATLITYSKASGTVFAFGTTTVTVKAFDLVGNCTVKTFTVTVRDTTPPTINSWSGPVTVEATGPSGAVVTYAPATATDAVGPVTISYSKSSGSTFAIGTTTVTVTATDGAGNSTSKTFTVTVRDTTAPVLTQPSIVVEATSSSGAKVTYPSNLVTDAVGVTTLTFSKASGSIFAIGTTTVTFTAKDAAGNTLSGSFTVVVRDTTPPKITSISPNLTKTRTSSSGAYVSYAAATATDAVGPVTITYSKSSGSLFPVGTTTVTVTATDGAGNVSTATFTVTVT